MARQYPIERASSAPATGRMLYEHLMKNIKIPASANHEIWYAGAAEQMKHPDKYSFRGDIPVGSALELVSLKGNPIGTSYTFTGKEDFVLVSDLSDKAREELGIPANARGKDKVYNANFKKFDDLPQMTKYSNSLAALSVPKSISSYLAGVKGKVNYSEKDVEKLLTSCFDDMSGPEMMHFLHGNHLAWAALAYIRSDGNVSGDLSAEFHAQNPEDFYGKDLGTVLPAIFFALSSLGKDPMEFHNKMDVDVWGAKEAAEYMRQYMPK